MLAFEGAQGFGAQTKGGRGGEVVKVTNLDDSGVGSLRWALEDLDQKRIVVFEVGGQIDLKDQIQINGDVTVAGQTAPGGITVTGGRLRVVESEVIIRGLNVRPGDAADGSKPDDRDGIAVGKRGSTVENVVIDSNSISWSVDELASTWGAPKNVTFSNNIMAEALQSSIHPKGDHSMGLLIGDGSSNVSVVGNLLASNEHRNATIKDDAKQIEFVNNVVHNYGPNGLRLNEGSTANVVSNIYQAGPDSAGREAIRLESPQASTAYYLSGNEAEVAGSATSKVKNDYVFTPRTTEVMGTDELLEHVLSTAGARAQGLNAIDARIIDYVRNGKGKIIDSPDEVGGYLDGGLRRGPRDSDDDGIPDSYESLIGSDPNRADAQADADKDGYANIEDYINGLIDGFDTKPGTGGDKAGDTAGAPAARAPAQSAPAQSAPAAEAASATGSAAKVAPGRVVEAETLQLSGGLSADTLNAASGNGVVRARSDAMQRAEMDFDGASGRYDLTVNYFDENDGVSRLAVQVNGRTVAEWDWDQDLGSFKANNDTRTSKVIEGLELAKGDTVTLLGTRDGKEPLRIDTLEFAQSTGGSDAAAKAPEAPAAPEKAAPAAPATALHLEAEDFDLSGFVAESLKNASGGIAIRRDGRGEHSAETDFEGEAGLYDIVVNYFDENDGASRLAVELNGEALDAWIWDADLGDRLANNNTLTRHVIEDVRLQKGDRLSLSGEDDGGEPLRIDSFDFLPNDLLAA